MAAQLTVPNDGKAQFLDLTPPHWAARGLAYALLAICLLGGLAAFVLKMPETVTARFVLVPVRGADPVKAARAGTIARVFTNEGAQVQAGELLATLRSDAVGDRAADWLVLQTQLASAGDSFLNAKTQFATQRLSDAQEQHKLEQRLAHLASLLSYKRNQLELTRKMAESYETLYREGIASQAQYTGRQMEVSELSGEVERLLSEQAETRVQIEKLKLDARTRQTEFREVERKLKESTATTEIRAAALKAGLSDSDGDEVKLAAPCSGTVLKLYVKGSGAVVGAGETIADLVCAGEALQAELSLPEAGLGKLRLEQGVKLKYDAFPYQRFGVKYGRVAWVSPASSAVEGGSGQTFKARVELADRAVLLQGQPKSLLPGMSGQADIVIGKRSLVSYIFEPLRQLKENMSDVPQEVSQR
jgi:membrane fusion protein